MKRNSLVPCVLALFSIIFLTAAGKRDPFSISFHIQGEESEGRLVMVDPDSEGNLFFRVNPVLTHQQMQAFYSFPAEDGETFGAVFVLKISGQSRLASVAATESGKLLRAVVNGTPVDYLQVDRSGMHGGEIVIWKGLTEDDLKKFEKRLKRVEARR